MKFKAHIKLTEAQSITAKKFGNKETEYADVEFTLQDLVEQLTKKHSPLFTYSQMLIPWLLAGNQPEIVDMTIRPREGYIYFETSQQLSPFTEKQDE